MRKIFKKMLLLVVAVGISISLWSCTSHKESKIIFNSNEGSPIAESNQAVAEEPVPTKDGYTFAGWFKTSDFKDERVTFPLDLEKEDVTLYAKWEAVVYTITYHLNGGTNASANPSSYTILDEVALSDPTNGDKIFKGWFSDSAFKTGVTAIKKGSKGNLDLYAKWEDPAVVAPANYTITYHLDGGTNHEDNPSSYKEATTVVLKDATKKGYTFVGWFSDSSYKNKVTGVTKDDKANLDFYAKFEIITYTITYHLDGGTNRVENPESFTILDEVTFLKPTKDHMVFKGWYTDSEFNNSITEIKAGTTGNLDLYVKWEMVDFVIHYELDGGENSQSNPAGYTTGNTISLHPATKKGYTFVGWYTDASFEHAITEISSDSKEDKTLFAKFILEEYDITYHLNGGTNGDNPSTYTVKDAVVLVDANKLGYTFAGWYLDEALQTAATGISLGSTGEKHFYAKFANTYDLMYGTWSKDNYDVFLEVSSSKLIYKGVEYSYTMNDFTSAKITVGNDLVSFSYNPENETITFVREYYRTEDDLDRVSETSTLTRITLPDTKDIAGTYYTGDSRTVKNLVIDAYGHLTRFDGSDTYQGTATYENNIVTLAYKTTNQGDTITYTGTLENGVMILTKDEVTKVYVKGSIPKSYLSDNSISVYQFDTLCVVEVNGNDYVAEVEGEFVVDSLITLAYNQSTVKFKVTKLPTDFSWGLLEAGKEHAGSYKIQGTEDVLVLDGFGPTNGLPGDALLNNEPVQYAMVGYMKNMLVIHTDHVEKFYQIQDRTLIEVTEKDGMEGKYASGTSYFEVSGLGYYKRSGASYYDTYVYDEENKTIKLNSTTYTIYHKGNVLSTGTSHYVKEGYQVEEKSFTDYLDKPYMNATLNTKFRISYTDNMYSIKVLEQFTLNGNEVPADTVLEAVYVFDRLVATIENVEVEFILTDLLSLVVGTDSYELEEAPVSAVSEYVGTYVNGNYFVRLFLNPDDETKLKVTYAYYTNAASTSNTFDVDVEEKTFSFNNQIFTFTNDNQTKYLTGASTNAYDYKSKDFELLTKTVELKKKDAAAITMNAGSFPPSLSSIMGMYVDDVLDTRFSLSWTNSMTSDQRNTPGTYSLEAYSWAYGVKYTVMVDITVLDAYSLTGSAKEIVAVEDFSKADIIALNMFKASHNGTTEPITEDMITLPVGFDSNIPGEYMITCTYHDQELSYKLTIKPNPYLYVYGSFKSSDIFLLLTVNETKTGGTVIYDDTKFSSTYPTGDYTGTFTVANNRIKISLNKYDYEYDMTVENGNVLELKYYSSTYYSNPTYPNPAYYLKSKNFSLVSYDNTSFEGKGTNDTPVEVKAGAYSSASSFTGSTYFKLTDNGSNVSISNVSVKTTLTAEELKTVDEVYAIVANVYYCGILFEATTYIKIINNPEVNYPTTTYLLANQRTNAEMINEILASNMFTAKLNGTPVPVTADMIQLPSNFDSTLNGSYTITCTYSGVSRSGTLYLVTNPVGTYYYASGDKTKQPYLAMGDTFTVAYDEATNKYTVTSGSSSIQTDLKYFSNTSNSNGVTLNSKYVYLNSYYENDVLMMRARYSSDEIIYTTDSNGGDDPIEEFDIVGTWSGNPNSYNSQKMPTSLTITKNSNGTYKVVLGDKTSWTSLTLEQLKEGYDLDTNYTYGIKLNSDNTITANYTQGWDEYSCTYTKEVVEETDPYVGTWVRTEYSKYKSYFVEKIIITKNSDGTYTVALNQTYSGFTVKQLTGNRYTISETDIYITISGDGLNLTDDDNNYAEYKKQS